MGIIELENISKEFKNILLFDSVNLKIEKGKIYGLIGPNGSGKSVLFKMISGFIFPTKGKISVRGETLGNGKNRFPENIGLVLSEAGFNETKTGYENLKELAAIRGEINDQEIQEALNNVGLAANLTQKVKNYSLGMKQKLSIAQAIMEDQDILILDEPFNALDEDSLQNIRALFLDLKNEGKTILLTSHNKEDIDFLCDRVYRINNMKLDEIN